MHAHHVHTALCRKGHTTIHAGDLRHGDWVYRSDAAYQVAQVAHTREYTEVRLVSHTLAVIRYRTLQRVSIMYPRTNPL